MTRKRTWLRRLGGLVLAGIVALNVLAYRHAHAMLFYVPGGAPPPRPEAMGWGQKLRVLFFGIEIPRPVNRSTPADRGLIFSTCMIPVDGRAPETASRCPVDGTRLEAWFIPKAAPRGLVVLFHGYQGAKESVLTEAEMYLGMGFSCLLVDFRGGGGSTGSKTTLGWFEAQDVAAAYAYADGLAGDAVPVILHGFSMGAAAILRAVALDGIQPDAIVLEAPFDRMLTTTRNRFRLLGAPAFPAAELLVFWGGQQAGFNGFRLNPVADAAQVAVPALVLCGRRDARATEAQVRSVFEALAGPKQLVVFSAAHESFAAGHPRKWQFVIDAFLQSRVHHTPL